MNKATKTRKKATAKKPQKPVPAPTSGKTAPVLERNRKESPQCAVENNGEQRKLGGITGRGFMPGQSGNPGGRPRSHGLLNVLRAAVGEVRNDGRTVEQQLVATLIEEALNSRNPLPAIQTIFDRLEGRPKQQLDVNDITEAMKGRSADDLLHYAQTGHWLEDESTAEAKASEEEDQHES